MGVSLSFLLFIAAGFSLSLTKKNAHTSDMNFDDYVESIDISNPIFRVTDTSPVLYPESCDSKLHVSNYSSKITDLDIFPYDLPRYYSTVKCIVMAMRISIKPTFFQHMKSVRELELHVYRLPDNLFSSVTQLSGLKLIGCHYTPMLPSSISCLTKLEILYIKGASKLKSIGPEIGKLASLRSLYLKSNFDMESISRQVSRLTALDELKITNNITLHTIPGCVLNLPSLNQAYIKSNGKDHHLVPTACTAIPSLKELSARFVIDNVNDGPSPAIRPCLICTKLHGGKGCCFCTKLYIRGDSFMCEACKVLPKLFICPVLKLTEEDYATRFNYDPKLSYKIECYLCTFYPHRHEYYGNCCCEHNDDTMSTTYCTRCDLFDRLAFRRSYLTENHIVCDCYSRSHTSTTLCIRKDYQTDRCCNCERLSHDRKCRYCKHSDYTVPEHLRDDDKRDVAIQPFLPQQSVFACSI